MHNMYRHNDPSEEVECTSFKIRIYKNVNFDQHEVLNLAADSETRAHAGRRTRF